MVQCEYCDKECPRRTTIYILVVPTGKKRTKKFVEDNHMKLKICDKCDKEMVEEDVIPPKK